MLLEMQGENGWPQDLPAGDDEVDTNDMGDCVSLVVLWNQGDGRYQNVRGFHGYGGFGAINLNALLQGVPNDNGTLVVACLGRLASSSAGSGDPGRVSSAIAQNLGNANFQMFEDHARYTVSRDGSCRPH